ncbi:serine kinase [Xanthomonas arboricola pv. zantedeschiae]|uniref:HrpF/NolX family T3SS translocon protein n=1 Tax=Xanthomonas arboricola TaxID=56448 RepID=UPI000CEDBA9A|nr:HrpF/NolX family T3SS translocon protein [Xanthomonas arboricola]PPT84766.1 serine kinase [Xanthomonas arboricola pv. zantedeschiae]
MSLNTLSTGSAAGLFLPLTDDASSSEAPGSDSAMNDPDLLLAMDNLFLQQIYNLIAATYGNTPISEPYSDVPGLGTPSADDVQAGQPIEKRTSWPSLSTPFDAKDIKGSRLPPAVDGSSVTWDGGTLTASELQIVSTLNHHKDKMPLEFAKLDETINDPSTPADLKSALQGLQKDPRLFFAIGSQGDGKCGGKIKAGDLWDFSDHHQQVTDLGGKNAEFNPKKIKGSTPPPAAEGSTVTWDGGTLTQNELEIVTILDRHKDKMPVAWADLDVKINDPATPPDLKQALTELQTDPRLFFAIGSQGDGKCGGKIKAGDLSKFSAGHAQVAEYANKQAKGYTQNYVASDSPDKTQPTVMTESDAMREFYRYSDYLPKDLNQDAFKHLVEGDDKTQKRPPQVIAAAQYLREHPDQWKDLAGDAGSLSTPDFLQKSASQMHLTAPELKTLDTIDSHQDAFFGDGKEVTRNKLDTIVKDDKADHAVRDAAKQLLGDPLLFGLLNNSITGYKKPHSFFGGGHVIDSGKISNKDFRQFYDHITAVNKVVQKLPTHAATSPDQKKAVADMLMGKADQPEIKHKKKDAGTLGKGLHEFLKWDSKIMDWASVGLSALNGIPIIGEIADAGALALESEAQAAQVIDTALQGGDTSLAWKLAGINMAGAVVGAAGGPSARLAAKGVAEGAAKGAAKGATEGAAKGATEGAAKGAGQGLVKGEGKGAAKGQERIDGVKGYLVGNSINQWTDMLKAPVLAGLHYEEVRLDKEKKKGEIRQNLEDAGGVPLGKQIIPKDVADNFEADAKKNLRNLRGRRR